MADISAHPSSFAPTEHDASPTAKHSMLRRALKAIMEGRQRKADLEVAAILARRGELFAGPRRVRSDDALQRREAIRSRA